MSVLDRVRKTVAQDSSQSSTDKSSDQEISKSQVMARIHLVVNELVDYANQHADGPFVNHLWVIKSMFESVSEELDGATDDKLGAWMAQFGMLMQWCAYGNSDCLPPDVVDYLRKNHAGMLALEASKM